MVVGMQSADERPDRRDRRDRLERLVSTARADLRNWTDATDHDPGVALLELFAFLGDMLSSYAEAVGRESFLPTGLGVVIDDETWEEVASLESSGPDEPHYAVSVAEDGATIIHFGDGVHGRRPPVGGGLVVRYRSGGRYRSVALQRGRVATDSDWNEPHTPTACGIHRAVVVDAVDPNATARLLVEVPAALGSAQRWALPCLPAGVLPELPAAGATVWVAFEACDLEHPVWLGRAP